jgi:hypothetical protein
MRKQPRPSLDTSPTFVLIDRGKFVKLVRLSGIAARFINGIFREKVPVVPLN